MSWRSHASSRSSCCSATGATSSSVSNTPPCCMAFCCRALPCQSWYCLHAAAPAVAVSPRHALLCELLQATDRTRPIPAAAHGPAELYTHRCEPAGSMLECAARCSSLLLLCGPQAVHLMQPPLYSPSHTVFPALLPAPGSCMRSHPGRHLAEEGVAPKRSSLAALPLLSQRRTSQVGLGLCSME